ncbi:MAG TPA: hypothetical protein DEG17_22115 [Cyanobacteria bacterium UBA11149]|nr:hypothetical protein [Cyanobacteria bacterium UBA11367]HBK65594.1 hypothetical protein [Cyanobacteria bacterium UBA11166]HBR74532.1 hypothetical protein [Cyanobacteria bacterium UBA11159]HBW91478.1 hypothetical protein [Cyanobacteria bacterium UBA11149]HCA97238.1 hypothetical protein [Cyanobacteria bacterium UBA9226]
MLPNRRLAELEKILDIEYRKISKFQERMAHTASVPEEFDLEERIRKSLMVVRNYEGEYWDILRNEVSACPLEETEASHAIVEVVRAVELIEGKSDSDCPDELNQLLGEVCDTLKEPENAAPSKVKLALPLIPGILSYELELDTAISLRRAFQPLKQLFKKAIAKK